MIDNENIDKHNKTLDEKINELIETIDNKVNKRVNELIREDSEYFEILSALRSDIKLNCEINSFVYIYNILMHKESMTSLFSSDSDSVFCGMIDTDLSSQNKRRANYIKIQIIESIKTYLSEGIITPILDSKNISTIQENLKNEKNIYIQKGKNRIRFNKLDYNLFCCALKSRVIKHYVERKKIAGKITLDKFIAEYFAEICDVFRYVLCDSEDKVMSAMVLYVLESHINIKFLYIAALKLSELKDKNIRAKERAGFLKIVDTLQIIVVSKNMYFNDWLDRAGEYNYHNMFVIGQEKLFEFYDSKKFTAIKMVEVMQRINSIIHTITEELLGNANSELKEYDFDSLESKENLSKNSSIRIKDYKFGSLKGVDKAFHDNEIILNKSVAFCKKIKSDTTSKMLKANKRLNHKKCMKKSYKKTNDVYAGDSNLRNVLSHYKRLYNTIV